MFTKKILEKYTLTMNSYMTPADNVSLHPGFQNHPFMTKTTCPCKSTLKLDRAVVYIL